jgi:hypothetical protein
MPENKLDDTKKLLLLGEKGKGKPLRWNQQQFTTQPGPDDKLTQLIKEFL